MHQGGREITRPVDLATMPLYVRAGAIVPTGPVKQHTAENPDAPLTLTVYPGADGTAEIYEDDGVSFAHESGKHRTIAVRWHDAQRRLVLAHGKGSDSTPHHRKLVVRIANHGPARDIVFDGGEQTLHL